jgi:membrane protein
VRTRELLKTCFDVVVRVRRDQLSLLSAAVAFYALLALFPLLLALVSLYGLLANPHDVEALIERTALVLPSSANSLLASQLADIIQRAPTKLGISVLVSVLVALWTTSSGMAALMRAVRYAHRLPQLALLTLRVRAIALTLGTLAFGVLMMTLLVIVPIVLSSPRLPIEIATATKELVDLLRWPTLIVVFSTGVLVIYRSAGAGTVSVLGTLPGVLISTTLWLAASYLFTRYVEGFASYNQTYGAIGAVVVLEIWLFMTAFCTLLGAELNAAIAHHRDGRLPSKDVLEVPVE